MASKLTQLLLQFPVYRRHVLKQADVAKYIEGKGYLASSSAAEIEALLPFLSPENVTCCVDAGANHGNYSAALLAQYPQAGILAVEPSSVNTRILQEKFSNEPRVTVLEAALCAKNGPVPLFSDRKGSSKASLTQRDLSAMNLPFDQQETVAGRQFDDVWQQELKGQPIDLLKLDVEGHELEVLQGSMQALAVTKVVQFEFGGCNIDTRTFFRDFWNFFQHIDFSLFRITPFGNQAVTTYHEKEEHFQSMNYIALNRKLTPGSGA
jgi:FkbM family methyltransferase